MLTRSTPEGARDFLVPSRLQRGSFYALPQSPQLFKQMLMVAGFERYYQIARCFRDEDLRADRQLDFTQLDVELSFVEVDDVIGVNERMLAHVLGAVGIAVELPLPRIPYDEAMARYGSDKPDLRYGLEIVELTDVFRGTGFNAFGGAIEAGGVVRGLNAGGGERSRAELDGLVGEAQELGAKGLVWAVRESDGWRSPIAKFLSDEEIAGASEALGASEGDLLLLSADEPAMVARVLGALRTRLAARQGLVPEGEHSLCWVVDWPLVEWNADEERWDPMHHPFTSPAAELDPSNPGEAGALAYDIAWNGEEIGGGSIRISDPEVQRRAFAALGIGEAEAIRALRLPARGAALRRAAARRDRLRHRPHRRDRPRSGVNPRRHRLPEGRVRRRPADGRARAGRRRAAPRARHRASRAPGRRLSLVSVRSVDLPCAHVR